MDYENHNGVMRSGKITIYNMDCMELLRQTPDKYYDLCVVDPPYGIKGLSVVENRSENSKYRKSLSKMVKSANKWNAEKPNINYFNELFRVSKEQIIWGANNFCLPETEYFCIWDKHQTVDNFASAEYAWVSMNEWKKPAKVFRYQIHIENGLTKKIHPTQKPVKLYHWLLQNYAKPGQRILDTHLGSGSSAIAAHYFGVDFVGCEIDETYYKDATERFKRETAQETLFNF